MKKILALIFFSLSFCQSLLAQPVTGSPTIWEKALFGEIPGITVVRLEGINAASTTTTEALWTESNVYTPLAAAMSTPYCASSSANDTAAGTGARTISVKGVDTSFARFNETVTLNGTASVNLATANVLFIDSLEVLTAGSGGLNAGIVQCGTGANTGGDPAVTHAHLPISSLTTANTPVNRSAMFFYGVPADHTLICKSFNVSVPSATAAHHVIFFLDAYTNLGLAKRSFVTNGEAGGPATAELYIRFPEKTLIVGQVQSMGGTTAFASASCLLVNNSWEDSSQVLF